MLKPHVLIISCLLFFFSLTGIACAEAAIAENPQIKVIINGEPVGFSCVPITVNERALLPLRELLVALDVRNDDEHIIWNEEERSVTVKREGTEIYLKVGSNEALVNNLDISLDVAPVDYKDRVYIPARFAAQAFGKKVVWYETTNTILIRDEEEFEKIREIIGKADAAMNELRRAAYKQETTAKIIINGKVQDVEALSEGRLDRDRLVGLVNGNISYKNLNTSINQGMYLSDKNEFVRNIETGKWEKRELSEAAFLKAFEYSSFKSDVAYAGLTLEDNPESGEFILKGQVFPEESFKQKLHGLFIEKYSLATVYYELHIDKDNYIITKSHCDLTGKATMLSIIADFNLKFTETCGSFAEEMAIEAPPDLEEQ